MKNLYWLPKHPDFSSALQAFDGDRAPVENSLNALRQLAGFNLDFVQTANLDRRLTSLLKEDVSWNGVRPLRLAILSSCTIDQLVPSIRIAALRRGLPVDIYVAPYNLYRQQILDTSSELYRFRPDSVLLSLDPYTFHSEIPLASSLQEVQSIVETRLAEWQGLHKTLAQKLQTTWIQETLVIPPDHLLGEMDAATPTSRIAFSRRVNQRLADSAIEQGMLIFDVEQIASQVGKDTWCDSSLWFHAKQAVSPAYAPLYGDHLARLLGAIRGLSYKCLVLDLDNTLWGGVIGDDGLEGIELGEGTGRGEAFLAFQSYVKRLSERGVVLAVCSKNDRETALSVFKQHPEMRLKLSDFAAFIATWDNKADNIKAIAQELNIGVDSIVFFDDNPAERKLVRQVLPSVAVPEISDEPAVFARTLSDAGYFESIRLTQEDSHRAAQYRSKLQAQDLQKGFTDIDSFLASLQMTMDVRPFDAVGRPRIAQLINKSNQYNLTTRRYTEDQIREFENRADWLTLQVRLADSCGDSGMISVVIAKPAVDSKNILEIDTWLMSCRVLGRQVEDEVLNVLVDLARQKGFTRLRGDYIATSKNALVRDHYQKLGFQSVSNTGGGTEGQSRWELELTAYKRRPTRINSGVAARSS